MERMRAGMLIALVSCSFALNDPAAALRPAAAFSVEMRVASPALLKNDDDLLVVKIGIDRAILLTKQPQWTRLTQSMEAWCEAVRDAFYEQIRRTRRSAHKIDAGSDPPSMSEG